MEISLKDIFRNKKLKKELLNNPLESGNDTSGEAQEEFEGKEANEESHEVEAENEEESGAHHKEITEIETQEQTDEAENNVFTPDNGEVDTDNDLEKEKDTDHISDDAKKEMGQKKGMSNVRKRLAMERIRKLKG